jgi:hypothetical protein
MTTTQGRTTGEAGSSATPGGAGGATATQTAGTQGADEKRFSQTEVDRLISGRLAEEKEREKKRLEAEQAKSRGEWEKVAGNEKERADRAEQELRATRAESAAIRASTRLNIIDPEAALVLIRDRIEFDKVGKPTNIDTLLADLAKEKSYLVKAGDGTTGQMPQTRTSIANSGSGRGAAPQRTPGVGGFQVPGWNRVFKRS